ncbi:MAG: transcriptional repressor [Anaerolineales bacterium]|nr:MAG: transcriptional repressor [Anaerolineales bacterium]
MLYYAKLCKYKDLHMSCGERLAHELRKNGYRVTAQRTILLETIAHLGGHLSVQDIYQAAQQRLPGLNLATVYRTIDSLRDADLIDGYALGSEPMQFALRDREHPHGHLVCRNCGVVDDLDLSLVKSFAGDVRSAAGFHIDGSHLTLQGLCSACASDRSARSTGKA